MTTGVRCLRGLDARDQSLDHGQSGGGDFIPPSLLCAIGRPRRSAHRGLGRRGSFGELRDDMRKLGIARARAAQGTVPEAGGRATGKRSSRSSRSSAADRDTRRMQVAAVADYMKDVYEARTPLTLHVLGYPPDAKYGGSTSPKFWAASSSIILPSSHLRRCGKTDRTSLVRERGQKFLEQHVPVQSTEDGGLGEGYRFRSGDAHVKVRTRATKSTVCSGPMTAATSRRDLVRSRFATHNRSPAAEIFTRSIRRRSRPSRLGKSGCSSWTRC